MTAIKTIKLTKKYKDTVAVDSLELEIEEGEVFALLGINGAGKSTTVNMLACLCRPTLGDALLLGKSINTDSRAVREIIGLSPQETAVAPNLSVKENMSLICGVHGFSKEKTEKKIAELVDKLDLSSVIAKKAGKLSGGWQRRLSIAMALVCEPRILFLDEPTLGLDIVARSELWELIRGLRGNVTVILTTHYMEEAEALSDRIGIMADGRLLSVGSAEELKALAGTEKIDEAFIKIVKGEVTQ